MEIMKNETIIKESSQYPQRLNTSRIVKILSTIGRFVVVTRVKYNHTKSKYTVMDHMIIDRDLSKNINESDIALIRDCEDHPHMQAFTNSNAWRDHNKLTEIAYENYHHDYYKYINGATYNKRYFTGIWNNDRDKFIYMFESQNPIITIV